MADEPDPFPRPEARYDDAPCGLLSTAPNGVILAVNRTLCTWLGCSAAELRGKRLQDLLTIGGKIFHQTHFLPLLQMQGSIAEVQLDLVGRNGLVLPALVNAVVRHEGEAIFHDVAIFHVGDRRKYERELVIEKKRAEALLAKERESQEALRLAQARQHQDAQQRAQLAEELIGIVSHDLRSPLSVVALGASLLAAGGVTPAQSRTLARITSAVHRASRLISDLLDFTQSRLGGGIVVHKREIDLHALAGDAVEELRVAWPGRMLEHRPTGPGTAIVDPDRLLQIVTNLVTNALTYGSPERAVTVSSSVGERVARLCVHNWGPAIPESLMPHLFEPMRRGEQQEKLGSRSVGLGLYIVHEIAGAHGGEVSVSSTPEDGTAFTVTLPW